MKEFETEKKLEQLKRLGALRKASGFMAYYSLSQYHDGRYESEFVSPYTKTAGNVNSHVMILLQDWSSDEKLSQPFDQVTANLGYTPTLPTNRNLITLLNHAFALELSQVFVTNVFPFIKGGNISSRIPQQDINQAFREFCLPQIEIVKPKWVICCGKQVYLAVLDYFNKTSNNLKPVGNYFVTHNGIFYHQRHTGARAINSSGGVTVAKSDWLKMKEIFISSTWLY
jgi:hypothetical protein